MKKGIHRRARKHDPSRKSSGNWFSRIRGKKRTSLAKARKHYQAAFRKPLLEKLEDRHLLATNVLVGEVLQFRGADIIGDGDDNLTLDAAKNIYAINFRGDHDGNVVRTVKGVDFISDNGGGTQSLYGGDVTVYGPREVGNWGNRPNYGSGSDEERMEDIMHDIRWSTPGQLHGADLAVVPGTNYRLELLISANHNEHRQWDITLDDGLQAVDGLKSLGIEGTAEGNSYDQGRSVNYRYDFVADDPKFEVRLGQFFGGGSGGDQNPIWQALTLHQTNEDPSIAELDGDLIQGYVPGSPNVAIDVAPAATVTDPDGSFGGGNLTVTRTSGGEPVDLLTVRAQQGGTGLDGGTNEVRVAGTTIGVMVSGGIPGQDLVIDFNANATAARVTTLMPLLEFGMIGNGGASHSKALEV
ncbi:MAG: hypothetical protein VB876_10020, partial [Pirellulales bacterium]